MAMAVTVVGSWGPSWDLVQGSVMMLLGAAAIWLGVWMFLSSKREPDVVTIDRLPNAADPPVADPLAANRARS